MEQTNEQHVTTLTKLLNQIGSLNVNEDSKSRLEAALRAAVEALEGAEPERTETKPESGIDLSDEATEHLSRVSQRLPTKDQERRTSAVNTLVGLTMNTPVVGDHDNAAKDLANLLLRTER